MSSLTKRFLRLIARDIALVARRAAALAAHLGCAYLLGWGALALAIDGETDWSERMLVGVIAYCALVPVVRTLLEWLDDRHWDAWREELRREERTRA